MFDIWANDDLSTLTAHVESLTYIKPPTIKRKLEQIFHDFMRGYNYIKELHNVDTQLLIRIWEHYIRNRIKQKKCFNPSYDKFDKYGIMIYPEDDITTMKKIRSEAFRIISRKCKPLRIEYNNNFDDVTRYYVLHKTVDYESKLLERTIMSLDGSVGAAILNVWFINIREMHTFYRTGIIIKPIIREKLKDVNRNINANNQIEK